MKGRAAQHLAGAGAVLLLFVSAWIGHTLEYVRLNGAAGLDQAVLGASHLYMLPLGAVLTLLLAHRGLRWWRRWTALGERLERARTALRSALHGRPPTPRRTPRTGSVTSVPVALLWAPLALGQVALYVLQESVEAAVAGRPAPGLGAVAGAHWAAPLVHAAVALVLATVVALAGRRLRGRATRLHRWERLVDHLVRACTRVAERPRPAPGWWPSPLQRFGAQLWSRPPPA
ncbi:MAG: hypothetical protein JWM18_697 [Chloroflexi bacterium]|nr:hypothetical protein [Chloroflexota bacterium]